MASEKQLSSQEAVDEFWETFITPSKPPTEASSILPQNVYVQKVGRLVPKGLTQTECVTKSYEDSIKICQEKVAQIVKHCKQINKKYSDPYFDLDHHGTRIYRLYKTDIPDVSRPAAVKRIGDIFDNPSFYVEGVNAKDIRQGYAGDCWFLAALAALCSMEPAQTLVEKVCVARDEDVGVYGFVFYRDGEWISVIVDDKLYMRKPDYEDLAEAERLSWEDNRVRVNAAEEYRKEFQSNSRALWFAQSSHPDETWVPLIEKAYAKAHGDYMAINGGYVHEGIEDLSGGVGTTVFSAEILSKDKFWEELLKVNEEFIFGCSSQDWEDPQTIGRDGIIGNHAYSVLKARNYGQERLLLVMNPWGEREWNGPWSDGSSQWTVEAIKELDHTFGDEIVSGIFWIRLNDFLRKYDTIWRTRLFGHEWNVTQQWTTLAVPWAGDYQDIKFEINIANEARTVIVLSKLDERYFDGFAGQYKVRLSLRLHKKGDDVYIARTNGEWEGQRSVNVELDLEAGTYEVRLKISASRNDKAEKLKDVVEASWLTRRSKLLTIGLSYDLAHAKGQLREPDGKPTKAAETTPVPKTETATIQETSAEPKPADTAKNEAKPEVWDANCVVGLRVYCKNADATIRIVRPMEEVPEKPKLDIDDPAKDASKDAEVVETSVMEKKESVDESAVVIKDAVDEKEEVGLDESKESASGEKKDAVEEKQEPKLEDKKVTEAPVGEKKDAVGEQDPRLEEQKAAEVPVGEEKGAVEKKQEPKLEDTKNAVEDKQELKVEDRTATEESVGKDNPKVGVVENPSWR